MNDGRIAPYSTTGRMGEGCLNDARCKLSAGFSLERNSGDDNLLGF